jgi:hypothetical protein
MTSLHLKGKNLIWNQNPIVLLRHNSSCMPYRKEDLYE